MRVSLAFVAKTQMQAIASLLKTDLRDDRVEVIVSLELAVYGMLKLLPPGQHTLEQLPYLFTGTLYPYLNRLNREEQKAWQNLQVLLPKFKAKRHVLETVEQYMMQPMRYRHVSLDADNKFEWQYVRQGEDRTDAYQHILYNTLEHSQNAQVFALTEKKASYYDEYNRTMVSIKLPNFTSNISKPSIDTSFKPAQKLEISKEELLEAAREMDRLDQKYGADSEWEKRIHSLRFSKWSEEQLFETKKIIINGTQHWLGTLSAGKSTIMDVAAYYMAKYKKAKTVLVVGDVAAVLDKVDMFQKMNISCVPILSANERKKHIEQYFYSLQNELENLHDLKRPALRYLTDVCLVQSMQDQPTNSRPPCYQLEQGGVRKICPYFHQCEYHNAFHDLPHASVIVATIQGLVLSQMPPAISGINMRMLEYVLRQTDLILVDEADRVQTNLDEIFAPSEEIAGTSGSWLENIHDKITSYLRKDKTCLNKPHVSEWIRSVHSAMGATIHIYGQLHQEKSIFDFVGKQFFTGYKLIKQFLIEAFSYGDKREDEESVGDNKFYQELHDRFQKLIRTVRSNDEFGDPLEYDEAPSLYFAYHSILDKNADLYLVMFLKLIESEYPFPKGHLPSLQHKLKFALTVLHLENLLFYLIHNFEGVQTDLSEALGIQDNLYSIFKGVPRDYDGIVPTAPTGIWLGFQYQSEEKVHAKNGVLKLMRYIGVGRHILSNLSSLFARLDGREGAPVVLLSGTSFAPGSPKYHVDVPVTYVVERKNESIPRIEQVFAPVYLRNNEPSVISGKRDEKRLDALRTLARRLIVKRVLENELEKCFSGRDRVLLVVGSYTEARNVSDELRNNWSDPEQIFHLVKEHEQLSEGAWPRQKVSSFAKSAGKILVAPLMALERGHNILTESNGRKVAAFSSAIFLVRPFPRPYDTLRVVSRINQYALTTYRQSSEYDNLKAEAEHIRRSAYAIQQKVIRANTGFRTMEEEERRYLIMDTLINIWQLTGRLIRGGVDAKMIYVDGSFAPETIKGGFDSTETSLLLGMRNELKNLVNDSSTSSLITILFKPLVLGFVDLKGVNQNGFKEEGHEQYA